MALKLPPPFLGCATALITPFRDGKIDKAALESLIEFQIDNGIHAIVLAGTTGESASLSDGEYSCLLSLGKEIIRGRVPLIAGAGSNCTAVAVQRAVAARKAGCDGLLSVTPYYNKASFEGLCAHFRAIADATPLPLILYSVPSRTGVKLTLKEYTILAEHPNITGVKEASGDVFLCEKIIASLGDKLPLYSGCDELNLPLYAMGAIGSISVVSNIFPREELQLYRAVKQSKIKEAAAIAHRLTPVCEALFSEVNPIPVKYAAYVNKLCALEYRLPLCPPEEKTKETIRQALESFAGA